MAARDLAKLASAFSSNFTSSNLKKLRRLINNNTDYRVVFDKTSIQANYNTNIKILERSGSATGAAPLRDFESHYRKAVKEFTKALDMHAPGLKGNRGRSGEGQFSWDWNASNTVITIRNIKSNPLVGQSTHSFLIRLRKAMQGRVFGYAGVTKSPATSPGADIGHITDLILTQMEDIFQSSLSQVIREFESTQQDRVGVLDTIAEEINDSIGKGNIPIEVMIDMLKTVDDTGEAQLKAAIGIDGNEVMSTVQKFMEVMFEAASDNRGKEEKENLDRAMKHFRSKYLPALIEGLYEYASRVHWEEQKASPALDKMIDTMIEDSLFSAHSRSSRFKSGGKSKSKRLKASSKVKRKTKHIKKQPKPVVSKGDIRNYIQDPRGVWRSPTSLTKLMDGLISATVADNMGSPALNYRTGRFSESVEVTGIGMGNARRSRQNQLTAYYTYMKRPYETFERKDKWGEFKNPRRLIDQSIREIATRFIHSRYDIRTTRQ